MEVILAEWLDANLPLVELAKELGIRYCCQAHGTDITAGLNDAGVRRVYERYNTVDFVIAPSEFGRRQLLQCGISAERTRVVRHAVGVPEGPARRESGRVRCLAVGRMDPMKGPLLVIDAVHRAMQACPDLHLDYVGDGAMMPAARELSERHQIQDRVTFHGFVPHENVLAMMRRSHILIQPSVAFERRYDTCPVTVAEAMANGMAIVASRHGGIPEQIVDGESGLLADEDDTRTMGEQLVALVTDSALRYRLGQAAFLRAKEMFSLETIRAQWLDLLGVNGYEERSETSRRSSNGAEGHGSL